MNKLTLSTKTRQTPKVKTVQNVSELEATPVMQEKVTKARQTPKVKTVRNVAKSESTLVKVEADVVEAETEVVAETEAVSEDLSFKQRFDVLIKVQQSQMLVFKSQVQELRKLQREHDRLVKDASRKTKKKKGPRDFSKPRRSTGFAEPVIVSDELYAFLDKTNATMKDSTFVPSNQEEYDNWPRVSVKAGVPVARTDITSHLSKYIKEHNLQNPLERREIVPNASLRKIFSDPVEPSRSDSSKNVYTYLKLQKYVNHHFPSRKTTVL